MNKLKLLEKINFFIGWICFIVIMWFSFTAAFFGLNQSKVEAVVSVCLIVVFSITVLIHQLIWQNQKNPRIRIRK